MRQIEALAQQLNEAGIEARIWEKSGKARIYLQSGKDIKAWIQFDNPDDNSEELDDLYHGVALRVYTDVENQPGQWIINRRKQVAHSFMLRLHEAAESGVIKSPLLASTVPCKDWREVILL